MAVKTARNGGADRATISHTFRTVGTLMLCKLVEGKGFEPSTSGVRFQRSPGLS